MFIESVKFGIPADNQILWRYMDFTKFVSLLDREELYFARSDYFEDPFVHDWIIFGTSWCGYCMKTKNFLKENQEPFDFIDLDSVDLDGSLRDELREWTGMRTIPIIFYQQELIGGYDDLIK